jgi:hypothetical protein
MGTTSANWAKQQLESLRRTATAAATQGSSGADGLLRSVLRVFEQLAGNDTSAIFTGSYVLEKCQEQGILAHRISVEQLVDRGYLAKDMSTRGGHRRYYRLTGRCWPEKA